MPTTNPFPETLLRRIERWLREHKSGQILLNAQDHQVKSFQFTEFGKIEELREETETKM